MEKRSLVCISCPIGCRLEACIEHSQVVSVTGHSCKRGIDYATNECTNPTRILTTTVLVEGGSPRFISVKTQKDIPKDKLLECIQVLKQVKVDAPVHIGDVIVQNILYTGVNIVATSNSECIHKETCSQ